MAGTPKSAGSSPAAAGAAAGSPQSHNTSAAIPSPEAAIVADDNLDETLDLDDNASSSASVTSSIYKYRYENGRTYHAYKDGAYAFPNDGRETDRLDLTHHLWQLTLGGKLLLCPADPEKLHRVLDAGTGTGAWAIDFADEHPNAQVVGIDLSPIQPSFVPPNVQFFVEDLEDTWSYSYNFDLIYGRTLCGSVSDWPKFFAQSFDNLNPGGWVEVADIALPYASDDGTLTDQSPIQQWAGYGLDSGQALGRPIDAAKRFADQLAEAGFVNVVERKFKWPVNNWPKDPILKEMGMWTYETIGKNISGLSIALFTRGLGWSAEEVEVFLVDVRKQWKDTNCHAYIPIHVVYAQRPDGT